MRILLKKNKNRLRNFYFVLKKSASALVSSRQAEVAEGLYEAEFFRLFAK